MTQEILTDEIIITMIKEESTMEAGFRALVKAYKERLYWHIRRMVHTHENAEDVLQNTFVKVYRNLDGFEERSKLYTWIYRIATNESINFLKKRKLTIDGELSQVENILVADPYFDGNEIQLALKSAIETLPERQKAVFNLRYYESMPYRDISKMLLVTEGALKANFHHAVKKIEAYLKNKT